MVARRPRSRFRRQVLRGNRDHGGRVGNASTEPKGRSRAGESRSVGYREVTPTSHWDAAARIRTWEPLRDETLNLAPFPSLATAAWAGIREMEKRVPAGGQQHGPRAHLVADVLRPNAVRPGDLPHR